MLRDEPHRFFGRHPVPRVEILQIERHREPPQCTFLAQVEVAVKVAHSELSQSPVHGIAPAASAEVGFRQRPPVLVLFVNRNDVIRIMFCFQIEKQRRIPVRTQCGSRKQSPFIAVRRILRQHPARGPGAVGEVVRHLVERTLNTLRCLQAAELAQFGGGEGSEGSGGLWSGTRTLSHFVESLSCGGFEWVADWRKPGAAPRTKANFDKGCSAVVDNQSIAASNCVNESVWAIKAVPMDITTLVKIKVHSVTAVHAHADLRFVECFSIHAHSISPSSRGLSTMMSPGVSTNVCGANP